MTSLDPARKIAGDWWDKAACKGHDPDLWFPPANQRHLAAEAIAICNRCPVRRPCLAYAEEEPREKFGVWGGRNFSHKRVRKTNSRKDQP